MSAHVLRAGASTVEAHYAVDAKMLGPALAEKFVELAPDDATYAFLSRVAARRVGAIRTRVHGLLRRVATPFDVNAWLGLYRLFVLGTPAWRTLLGRDRFANLLDVGAGVGGVTAMLAALADEVVATETSAPAVRQLTRQGYRALEIDLATPEGAAALGAERFELVSCLNVIDRAERPAALLEEVAARVAANGLAVIAVPLPYSPLHFVGGRRLVPARPLAIAEGAWEVGARSLAEHVLPAAGLEVVRFTRTPYLSEGDWRRRLYALDDAVFIAAPRA